MRLSPSAPSEVDVPPSPKRVVRARLGSASTDNYLGEGGGGSYPSEGEGVGLGRSSWCCGPWGGGRTLGELRFLLRSGQQTDACRFRRITASTRPREEKRKVFWGKHLPGWQYAEVHLVEGNPRKGVPASAISGVSARGPPRPLACISTRVRFRSQV